jgi:hypothetical protein
MSIISYESVLNDQYTKVFLQFEADKECADIQTSHATSRFRNKLIEHTLILHHVRNLNFTLLHPSDGQAKIGPFTIMEIKQRSFWK